MVEYEALLLGLAEAKKLQIKMLKVKGDAELIVKQVRCLFTIKNERPRHYKNCVWDEIEAFDAFSIEAVPREFNSKADCLTTSATLLVPHPDFTTDTYRVESVYRLSVPDTSKSWKVFENDRQIHNFLWCANIFTSLFYEGLEASCKEFSLDSPEELHDGVLQLKGNKIPKDLVSLERLFDRKDGYVKQGEKETPVIQNSSEYE